MSTIQWNKVTWYSKLLAVVIFLITFYLGFTIGREFQGIKDDQQYVIVMSQPVSMVHSQPMMPIIPPGSPSSTVLNSVSFKCDAGKTINAQFRADNVTIELSDGRNMTLPHAISADGARYANADETFVFWTKGQGAFVTEGSSSSQTYSNCLVTNQVVH